MASTPLYVRQITQLRVSLDQAAPPPLRQPPDKLSPTTRFPSARPDSLATSRPFEIMGRFTRITSPDERTCLLYVKQLGSCQAENGLISPKKPQCCLSYLEYGQQAAQIIQKEPDYKTDSTNERPAFGCRYEIASEPPPQPPKPPQQPQPWRFNHESNIPLAQSIPCSKIKD